jgi:hypothetical protein
LDFFQATGGVLDCQLAGWLTTADLRPPRIPARHVTLGNDAAGLYRSRSRSAAHQRCLKTPETTLVCG